MSGPPAVESSLHRRMMRDLSMLPPTLVHCFFCFFFIYCKDIVFIEPTGGYFLWLRFVTQVEGFSGQRVICSELF